MLFITCRVLASVERIYWSGRNEIFDCVGVLFFWVLKFMLIMNKLFGWQQSFNLSFSAGKWLIASELEQLDIKREN